MASVQAFLTIPEAAQRLRDAGINVTSASLRRWVRKGQLPAIKLPNGRAQIRPEDLEALMAPAS